MKSFKFTLVALALCAGSVLLTGCAEKTASGRIASYFSGQMYGNGGATPCVNQQGQPVRSDVDGGVPFCGFPADGDSWDPRNR